MRSESTQEPERQLPSITPGEHRRDDAIVRVSKGQDVLWHAPDDPFSHSKDI
jgi:hypothetical protein